VAELSVRVDANASASECRLVVVGEVDLDTADRLAQAGLLAIAEYPTRTLVVDLQEVTFMDSTGLKALLTLRNGATGAGTRMLLRNVSAQVQKILSITALDQVLAPETVEESPVTFPHD
jgi:anti-sigma B factor antagonist